MLSLPPPLLQLVLYAVDAEALAALLATCRELRVLVSGMDGVWHRRLTHDFPDAAVARVGKAAGEAGAAWSWCKLYQQEASVRCAICRCRTPYVFSPTNRRLCADCEREHPEKFRLLTPEMARAEMGSDIPPSCFVGSPSVHIKGLQFFLAAEVARRAQQTPRKEVKSSSESDDDSEEEPWQRRCPDQSAVATDRKAERKANKKQAKLLARLKRADAGADARALAAPSRNSHTFCARPKSHREHVSRAQGLATSDEPRPSTRPGNRKKAKALANARARACADRGGASALDKALADVERVLGEDWQLSLSGLRLVGDA